MRCNSNQQENICLCQDNFISNPAFWSKKKKITLLEEHLECLQKQIIEIQEALEELKEAK